MLNRRSIFGLPLALAAPTPARAPVDLAAHYEIWGGAYEYGMLLALLNEKLIHAVSMDGWRGGTSPDEWVSKNVDHQVEYFVGHFRTKAGKEWARTHAQHLREHFVTQAEVCFEHVSNADLLIK